MVLQNSTQQKLHGYNFCNEWN